LARVCDRLEIRLAELLYQSRGQVSSTLAEVAELSRLVQANHSVLNEAILSGRIKSKPLSARMLSQLMPFLAKVLFSGTNIPELGRFRIGAERVTVDSGRHAFEGSHPSTIEAGLDALMAECIHMLRAKPGDIDHLANVLGYLLVGIFKIHPLSDGNGRIGRMILRLVASSEEFDLLPFKVGAGPKRAYLEALRYAHRSRRSTDKKRDGRLTPRDCMFMAKFIRKHLRSRVAVETEEIEPQKS
jgi:Fic family protein